MRSPLFHLPDLALRRSRRSVKQGARADHAQAWTQSFLPGFGRGGRAVAPDLNHKPLVGVAFASVLLLAILGYQLFNLQIINGQRFRGLADGNRLRANYTYAQRGRILDRHGKILADNIPSFQLVVTPYLLPKNTTQRNQLYQKIASYSGVRASRISKRAEARGLNITQPLLVEDDISYKRALILEAKAPDLPGFNLDAVPIRRYKSGAGLAHVLGYVGRISEEELKKHPDLSPVDFIGKDGVEAVYDKQLRGQDGVVQTEVDATGRSIRTLAARPTQPGKDVVLNIDYGLQKALARAVKKQITRAGSGRGAAAAVDPRSGEVLAMVSFPDYDDNLFAQGISAADYQKLVTNPKQPLNNRAISGAYPSGSIIKPIHLTAALQEKVVNENTTIVDQGKITVPSVYDPSVTYTFTGWNSIPLGPVNAREAIRRSSDIYFYTVGGGYQGFKGLGAERLSDYYKRYGFGRISGVDLPGEAAGRVPTPAWKKQTTGQDWFVGDTYNISIGQGDFLTSPLQMVLATAAITNNGKVMQPHVVKQIRGGQTIDEDVVNSETHIKHEYLQITREGMREAAQGGTVAPTLFAGVGVPVAGKTGTAENGGKTTLPHSWFTSFAPYREPRIVTAIIIENAGEGTDFAAPATAETLSWYFHHH